MTHSWLQRAVLATLAATALPGCVPLVVGGAAAAGTMVAVDRRSTGAQLDDESIELRAGRRVAEVLGETARVKVVSYDRLVLLTGEVPNATARQQAEAAARLPNVRGVVNALDITVSPSFQQKSADTVITGRVKASLIDAKDLQARAFKVTTERNVVYLMGRVTEREAARAVDIARGVGGVEKVVRVFDVVSEQELAGGAPISPAQPGTVAAPAPAPQQQPQPAGASTVAPVVTPIPPATR